MAKMLINIHKLALLVHLIENAANDFSIKTLETAILLMSFTSLILKSYLKKIFLN
jgi:hypothetical protein